ncbi:MAG: glycosyltransferase [Candidatus Njordarchaeia archaeon]
MKVLHIGNTAGVASIIAKWQKEKLNWKTMVITRRKFDPYNLTTYGYALPLDKFTYTLVSIILAFHYDIIHIHDYDKLIGILRKIPILKNKIIVIHYHGTRIRGRWQERKKYWKQADIILVSTQDLLRGAPPKTQYLPNPINTEIFKPNKAIKKLKNWALYIITHQPEEILEWPKQIAKRYHLNLYMHDRKKKPIPHHNLPTILNHFEYYIDKRLIRSKTLSKTALEALACGLKVISGKGKLINKLPKKHNPTYTVKTLKRVYLESILRKTEKLKKLTITK